MSSPCLRLTCYPPSTIPSDRDRGRNDVYGHEGLQPIELRQLVGLALSNSVPRPDRSASATLTVSPAAVDGAVAITVQAQSMSDLRSLEVLEGCDVIYSHSNQPDYRETTERVAIAAAFQASRQSPVRLTGAIRWHGAPSLRVRSSKNWPPEDIPEPSAWFYADESITHWPIIRYATSVARMLPCRD